MPFLDNCPLSPEFGICKICYFRKLFLFKKKGWSCELGGKTTHFSCHDTQLQGYSIYVLNCRLQYMLKLIKHSGHKKKWIKHMIEEKHHLLNYYYIFEEINDITLLSIETTFFKKKNIFQK